MITCATHALLTAEITRLIHTCVICTTRYSHSLLNDVTLLTRDNKYTYTLVAVRLSGILKGKQKLGVTFNSDKLGGIDFTKFSKLTMCSA